MVPEYIFPFTFATEADFLGLLEHTSWATRTEARRECFMSPGGGLSYTYGTGRGVRTYTSIPMSAFVEDRMAEVNQAMDDRGWGHMNVCFLNLYEDKRHHLGWHADDHEGTDHTAPICVVSFGARREIWWREKGSKGMVPNENRRLLDSGSLFIMPPGMQGTHEHRVPKADRDVGDRISLTFRRFLL